MRKLLFGNIGSKIKGVAFVLFMIQFLLYIVAAVIVFLSSLGLGSSAGIISGLLILGGGILIAWLSTIVLYGIGQLIDNTDQIKKELVKLNEHKSEL